MNGTTAPATPGPYPIDLLNRRLQSFCLWTPGRSSELVAGSGLEPHLVIGTFDTTYTPPSAADLPSFRPLTPSAVPLAPHPTLTDLWTLDPAASPALGALQDGVVYRYWFTVLDSTPEVAVADRAVVHVTDPLAYAIDYGLVREPYTQPASVVKFRAALSTASDPAAVALVPCDVDGGEAERAFPLPAASTPPPPPVAGNNHVVIYELPTTWTRQGADAVRSEADVDVGTFADVAALWDAKLPGRNFRGCAAVGAGSAHLADLGVNALELLPVADAKVRREWGYATAHYFAPDADLGGQRDLVALVRAVRRAGARWVADTVMAFGYDPYAQAGFGAMHIRPYAEPDDPDSWQSHRDPPELRDGYGGRSWRYIEPLTSYDPVTGRVKPLDAPSWAFHLAHQARWFLDFGVGGFRLDSVNNIGSWDFVRRYHAGAWALHAASPDPDPAKFLVIGEELSLPLAMITTGCLDALWNERWQERARAVILGQAWGGDDFEWTVRKLVSPLLDGPFDGGLRFTDGAQSINYVTSHDVQGDNRSKARLFDYLGARGVWDVEPRAKLAHVLLLTAVGIPMIFAGEEFADKSDRDPDDWTVKQTDPVNWERAADPWRADVLRVVSRLVRLRTACPALAVNAADVFHVDASRDAKIMAWRRGDDDATAVVVVANFSDEDTPGPQYVVPNWPGAAAADWNQGWREVSQDRDVPPEWVAREPLFAWEAKVYTKWRP